jgi:hypothetical protein
VEFFTEHPELVHVSTQTRERIVSATLPEVADRSWRPAPAVTTGLPSSAAWRPSSKDLWSYLAALGGLGLLTEWLLFGSSQRRRRRQVYASSATSAVPRPDAARERDLVSR